MFLKFRKKICRSSSVYCVFFYFKFFKLQVRHALPLSLGFSSCHSTAYLSSFEYDGKKTILWFSLLTINFLINYTRVNVLRYGCRA